MSDNGFEQAGILKRVRCKKELGSWFYRKINGGELDAPIYELYDETKTYKNTFGSFSDMKYYIETGIVLA